MKIALGQINTTVADFEGNALRIIEMTGRAAGVGADLAVFPELAVTGYPPKDMLLRTDFVDRAGRSLAEIARRSPIPVLIGTVRKNAKGAGKPLHNSAAFIRNRRIESWADKMLIPTYDVFDEARYFEPAARPAAIRLGGKRIGVTICEDVWNDPDFWPKRTYRQDPVALLGRAGFDILINLSASPFEIGKGDLRRRMLAGAAKKYRRPVLQVNLVGGNDELLFDGQSLAIDPEGRVLRMGKAFAEDLVLVDLEDTRWISPPNRGTEEEAYEALVMGTRDYAAKTGFRSAILGLSGGIDSAVTAGIAVEALGHRQMRAVSMPGPYSSKSSVSDSEALAKRLGIRLEKIPITPIFRACLRGLKPVFKGTPKDVTEENLQARIRGMILMALSNKFGHLLLTTGNKSELSVGYCTLYGDMCGGLAVISDVPKMLVYAIGRHINRRATIIPDAIFTKAPSAELRPHQTDQDSLPPYPVLDALIEAYVERMRPADIIRVPGLSLKQIRRWTTAIDRAEYKRRQATPGLKLRPRAFGQGRREPIARKI